jgi:hypothetical protein
MVAALVFLNRYVASRAVLDVVLRRPLLEQPVCLAFSDDARCTFVMLLVARPTYLDKARWALEDGALRDRTIDLLAIWSGTVVEVRGMRLDVCARCSTGDILKLAPTEDMARIRQGDRLPALPIFSKAFERKYLIF